MDTQQQTFTEQEHPVRRELDAVEMEITHLEEEIDIVPEAEQEQHRQQLESLKTQQHSLQEQWDTIHR